MKVSFSPLFSIFFPQYKKHKQNDTTKKIVAPHDLSVNAIFTSVNQENDLLTKLLALLYAGDMREELFDFFGDAISVGDTVQSRSNGTYRVIKDPELGVSLLHLYHQTIEKLTPQIATQLEIIAYGEEEKWVLTEEGERYNHEYL